ncbi:MAG: DUF1634 domain-containing protein [Vicinamibacterales bacterium]
MKQSHKLLGRLLAAGVTLSAICLAAGLTLTLVGSAMGPERAAPHPLLDAGLIVLMATPLVRVLVSLSEEIRDRNWFFASITLTVVAVLCATLWTAL